MIKVPFTNLDVIYRNHKQEFLHVYDKVASSGKHMLGSYTREFEETLADYCGRRYACVTGSGTMALEILFRSLFRGVPATIGIPNYSYIATRNTVISSGMTPVYIQTGSNGLIEDVGLIDTDAVVAVNLYGHMVDYDTVFSDYNGILIEDAAQSLGASYKGKRSGSFGLASVLSFDPMKNLPCFGAGGMILTDDEGLYQEILKVRRHNIDVGYGTNSVMSEMQCAEMLVKWKYFAEWQAGRLEVAKEYVKMFSDRDDVECVLSSLGTMEESSWHKFVVKVKNRTEFVSKLEKNGIEYRFHYDYMLDNSAKNDLCTHGISLPIYDGLIELKWLKGGCDV